MTRWRVVKDHRETSPFKWFAYRDPMADPGTYLEALDGSRHLTWDEAMGAANEGARIDKANQTSVQTECFINHHTEEKA